MRPFVRDCRNDFCEGAGDFIRAFFCPAGDGRALHGALFAGLYNRKHDYRASDCPARGRAYSIGGGLRLDGQLFGGSFFGKARPCRGRRADGAF